MPSSEEVFDRIRADRGHVPSSFETAARFDPGALAAFHESYQHAMGQASALDDKTKQLILIAVDTAQYFSHGIRFHMDEALRLGATAHEITSAMRLAGLVAGFHAPLVAYPLLAEAMEAAGVPSESTPEQSA